MAMATQFRISGDRNILAVYGSAVDPAINEKVRQMTILIADQAHPGIKEVVGSYCTLSLQYDPLQLDFEEIRAWLEDLEKMLGKVVVAEARVIDIPVCYGGIYGPDLDFVAKHNGINIEEAVALHSGVPYRIYAIGFAPGFCYLGGLNESLHTPRLQSPRQKVAAGSVGIAGGQTGVYPLDSPGGWQLIGRTPLRLFAPERENPLLYAPGDAIRFCPVAEEEFLNLQQLESL